MPLIHENLTNPEAEVAEEDLLAPALLALFKARENLTAVNATVLGVQLERLNAMSAADRLVAEGDRMNQFQRRVLNLVKKTLIAEKYARVLNPDARKADQKELTITPKGERYLARRMMESFSVLRDAPDRQEGRALENDLLRPALFLLVKMGFDATKGTSRELPLSVPMTDLRTKLRALAPKSPEDRATLAARTDSKIDQVIRNMISHNTLTSRGWVRRVNNGLQVSQAGIREVLRQLLDHIPAPDHAVDEASKPRRLRPR